MTTEEIKKEVETITNVEELEQLKKIIEDRIIAVGKVYQVPERKCGCTYKQLQYLEDLCYKNNIKMDGRSSSSGKMKYFDLSAAIDFAKNNSNCTMEF